MKSQNLSRALRAVRALLFFTLTLGVAYTLVITLIAQTIFPHQANGSLIEEDGKVVGSELISQPQRDDKYLWGRFDQVDQETFPGYDYGAPTNQAVTSPDYQKELQDRAKAFHLNQVPAELVTGSGSGLDPQISKTAALVQVDRIAKTRGIPQSEVRDIIDRQTSWNFGAPVVNVLKVNLALDRHHPEK
ncbi:hypothetical protein BSR29_01060 [Boudabousia liubingyangii]|uniref:Potassium-transporting ATPase KdpC subunit n=1 Tax=Boudabousia liubingyangii TaxID=1921764 RepID=A0A1Q5PPQ3_9ACTO|nr:potassium-transporting ATPase subunit C [Boudabousia liubingyangii]OKL49578.1 hypothetical protein BSR29_01060 [Boudabousia liubingyangii]